MISFSSRIIKKHSTNFAWHDVLEIFSIRHVDSVNRSARLPSCCSSLMLKRPSRPHNALSSLRIHSSDMALDCHSSTGRSHCCTKWVWKCAEQQRTDLHGPGGAKLPPLCQKRCLEAAEQENASRASSAVCRQALALFSDSAARRRHPNICTGLKPQQHCNMEQVCVRDTAEWRACSFEQTKHTERLDEE